MIDDEMIDDEINDDILHHIKNEMINDKDRFIYEIEKNIIIKNMKLKIKYNKNCEDCDKKNTFNDLVWKKSYITN